MQSLSRTYAEAAQTHLLHHTEVTPPPLKLIELEVRMPLCPVAFGSLDRRTRLNGRHVMSDEADPAMSGGTDNDQAGTVGTCAKAQQKLDGSIYSFWRHLSAKPHIRRNFSCKQEEPLLSATGTSLSNRWNLAYLQMELRISTDETSHINRWMELRILTDGTSHINRWNLAYQQEELHINRRILPGPYASADREQGNQFNGSFCEHSVDQPWKSPAMEQPCMRLEMHVHMHSSLPPASQIASHLK